MLKKILLAVAIAIPASLFAQNKIGVVDTQAIIESLPETAAAREHLDNLKKNYEQEYNQLTEEINKKVQEYQALGADAPKGIRERRQKEVQELDQRYQAFLQYAEEDLATQKATLMQPIEDKVNDAIKAVGAANGFSILLPATGILYVGIETVDATELVKAEVLNALLNAPAAEE